MGVCPVTIVFRGEGILPLRVAGILPAIRGRNARDTKRRSPLLSREQTDQYDAVTWDFGLELAVERAEVFLPPEVSDPHLPAQSQIGPFGRDGLGRLVPIEETLGTR